MTDVSLRRDVDGDGVIIQIELEGGHPPIGTAMLTGSAPEEFRGWLGLLAVLARLVDTEPDPVRPPTMKRGIR